MDWLPGYWEGGGEKDKTEEIWSKAMGGSIMGSFKFYKGGEISFYEILTISEENGSIILRIKHFDKHLNGWEEKNEKVEMPLVKSEKDKVYFDGLTFERISKKRIVIHVLMENAPGKRREISFPYKLKKRF